MLTRPSILLRIEEALLLTATLFAYQHLHFSWLLFAILFLTPDLFMLGYLVNARLGASNLQPRPHPHPPCSPSCSSATSSTGTYPQQLALIWTAHIALDRLLGFGLKYPTFFKDTHLQHI